MNMKKEKTCTAKLVPMKAICPKEHIGIAYCKNGKVYDLYRFGEMYGYYSKRDSEKLAGAFVAYDNLPDAIYAIDKGNDGCEEMLFWK